jgi:hypothetical protein
MDIFRSPQTVEIQDAVRWAACLPAAVPVVTDQEIKLTSLPYPFKSVVRFETIDEVKVNLRQSADPVNHDRNAQVQGGALSNAAAPLTLKGALQLTPQINDSTSPGVVVEDVNTRSLLDTPFATTGETGVVLQKGASIKPPPEDPVRSEGSSGNWTVTIPKGTTGMVDLRAPLIVRAAKPLRARPYLIDPGLTVQPIRAIAVKGMDQLALEIRLPPKSGEAGQIYSCAGPSKASRFTRIAVVDDNSSKPESDRLTVFVPQNLVPFSNLMDNVGIAVLQASTGLVAFGYYTAFDHLAAFIVALTLTLLLFGWLLGLRHGELQRLQIAATGQRLPRDAGRWVSGLFIPPGDQDPSLSLFQVFIWTVITFWGLVYVFVITGSLLSLTTQFLSLLGIAGTGSVLARWIAASRGNTPPASAGSAEEPNLANFQFWQILSTDGRFDLLRLQTFVFTLAIGVYVVSRIAVAGAFPELDTNTLLLMGVSQSVYIGGKLAGSTALANAQALKINVEQLQAELETLKNDEVKLTDQKKKGTPPLTQTEQDRLTAIPALKADREKQIADLKPKLAEAIKALNLAAS